MTRLQVEIEDFVAAARTMSDRVADPAGRCTTALGTTLGGCDGMAGNDPGGQGWAGTYDEAAWAVLQASGQIVNAAYTTAGMFKQSARNYAEAETASTTSGAIRSHTLELIDSLPGTSFIGDPTRPPTANGTRGDDGPGGWWIVEHSVGYVWPNGDGAALRRAADAWDRCGSVLSTDTCLITQIPVPFTTAGLPEAGDIDTVCHGFQTRLQHLAEAHWSLATACRQYAHHLDTCHDEVLNELSWLLGESAAIQTVGAIASVFSFGAAEAPTQAAQAGRIALAAKRIAELIQTFLHAVREVAITITGIAHLGREIAEEMRLLSNTRLAQAGVTDVSRATRAMSMTAKGRAAISAGRIGRAGARADIWKNNTTLATLPGLLKGRTLGDSGIWTSSRNLATHFSRHGREFGTISVDAYGTRATDLLHRAYLDKLPTKIDPSDGTIRVLDPLTGVFGCYRSDGAAITLFKPRNPFAYFARQPGRS